MVSELSTFFHTGTLIKLISRTESGINKYDAYVKMFISTFLGAGGYHLAQCILGQVLRAFGECIFAS